MKIAFLNDTHFGVKNGSDIFLDYQEKFFRDQFFPYCIENNIKQIIHLGDYFEHRKYINVKVLKRTREFFVNQLKVNGMKMDIFPGNHDTYFKSTNELNSLVESLQLHSDVVNVYMEPIVKEYGGLRMALLPWITSENNEESINFIKTADAPILCAHLELKGFEMMKGAPAMSHGMETDLFSRYEMVLTGHYHTKSTRNNIHYLGTQYELTWSDVNDPKYFHTIDTETRELVQFRNTSTLFNKIYYSEGKQTPLPDIKGSFVKVIVTSKKDTKKFDAFIDKIQREEPFDLKIVESYGDLAGNKIDDDSISLVDTGSLLNSYVDAIDTNLDKDKLKRILHELYVEAQQFDAL